MEFKERFERKIYYDPNSGCHFWLGATAGDYGKTTINGKFALTHRAAYELYCGSIPLDSCVCHTCDNRLCVNPDHLFVGTYNDNNQDKLDKGRQPNVKLSPQDVANIRKEYIPRVVTMKMLKEKYDVSISGIHHLLNDTRQ